jgi:hypothetical protein
VKSVVLLGVEAIYIYIYMMVRAVPKTASSNNSNLENAKRERMKEKEFWVTSSVPHY